MLWGFKAPAALPLPISAEGLAELCRRFGVAEKAPEIFGPSLPPTCPSTPGDGSIGVTPPAPLATPLAARPQQAWPPTTSRGRQQRHGHRRRSPMHSVGCDMDAGPILCRTEHFKRRKILMGWLSIEDFIAGLMDAESTV